MTWGVALVRQAGLCAREVVLHLLEPQPLVSPIRGIHAALVEVQHQGLASLRLGRIADSNCVGEALNDGAGLAAHLEDRQLSAQKSARGLDLCGVAQELAEVGLPVAVRQVRLDRGCAVL